MSDQEYRVPVVPAIAARQVISLTFLGIACVYAFAQGSLKTAPASTSADLRVDVSLALIPVTVTTPNGQPVLGLGRDDFRLFEDGIEQRITFLAGEDTPLSVGFVIDLSGSMKAKLPKSTQAATELLRSFDHREDEFFLVQFNERPKLVVPFTRYAGEIETQLRRAKPLGRTALLDAVHLARSAMQHARNARRAIVILSDGGDNHSRYTATEIRREMRESDVQIYSMALPSTLPAGRLVREERDGPELLEDIAAVTGGRHWDLTRLEDLQAVSSRIALELHNQYLIGYSPSPGNSRERRIRVVAHPAEPRQLQVHYRPQVNLGGR